MSAVISNIFSINYTKKLDALRADRYVSELDNHPMAQKSAQLHTLMLAALKYAVNPRGMGCQNGFCENDESNCLENLA